jgi:hypothetical protein
MGPRLDQQSCDVFLQVQNQQMGYAAWEVRVCIYPVSDGACHPCPSGDCETDCHWNCDVRGYHHDHDHGYGHGYGYDQGCGSSGGNRDLDGTFQMGGGTARGNETWI